MTEALGDGDRNVGDITAHLKIASLQKQIDALRTGKITATVQDMDQAAERDIIDAKIAAAEARTDTKFVRFESKLDQLAADFADVRSDLRELRSDNKNTRTTVIVTGLTSTFAIVTIVIAVLAYGAATFYNGTVVFDHKAAQVAPK